MIQLYRHSTKKLGLQGGSAFAWLAERGFSVPEELFDVQQTVSQGRIARLGPSEVMIESGPSDDSIDQLVADLSETTDDIIRIPHQESTYRVRGDSCDRLFAQTCGLDFRVQQTNRVIFTRVASVSCGVISEVVDGSAEYRIWVDSSYDHYLWETLTRIVSEIGCSTEHSPVSDDRLTHA